MRILFLSILLSGCGLMGEHAGPFINSYCEKPIEERTLIREAVAAEISPHRIHIICETDDQITPE